MRSSPESGVQCFQKYVATIVGMDVARWKAHPKRWRATALQNTALALSAQAKLISGQDGLAIFEMDFDQLFALDRFPLFVSQHSHDFAGFGGDDIAGGGIGKRAVHAESDPAGLIAELDGSDLFGRRFRVIENMHAAVRGVGKPYFFFVRGKANSMAGTAVAFHGSLVEALHL